METRVAGLFVFWPLLAQLGFDDLVKEAGYPGSDMVPATSALLSLLALKLIDKERLSHISDFNFDEALGLFAGLNTLPRATLATDDSYRTIRENQRQLLTGWVSRLLPRLDPQPDAFSLDLDRTTTGRGRGKRRGRAGDDISLKKILVRPPRHGAKRDCMQNIRYLTPISPHTL